jgi:EAL domain-containing protein (putative c-di-GMP-specific phosphodiesterase class I)
MISLIEFVPCWRTRGLIVTVGEWVLRGVRADSGLAKRGSLPLVAVNLSARQLVPIQTPPI